jgi:cell fate regulator YaaT (PSP1 superfamily)
MNDIINENAQLDLPESEEIEAPVLPTAETDTDPDSKTEIVGIRFKKNGKTYYFDPNGFTLAQGDKVIVDTSRGPEYGTCAVTNRYVRTSALAEPLRSVVRLATAEDTRIREENAKKEIEAFNTCIVLIDKHKLVMKLIDSELTFDRSKLSFLFSAEERVDFRELVKDLAGIFHTRIEMRQVGIRDEAKFLGGLGICGRPYCCNTFLTDFGQVSVKMAKEQNLSLNSAKISGSCGRLMCCLRFEYDTYLAEKAITPKVDARVVTPNGAGTVIASNPLAGIVKVRIDGQGEDADPIVFVREDVIEESKYDGQVLTKTDIPDRKHKNDDMPSLAQFAAPASAQDPAPVAPIEPIAPAEPVQKDAAAAEVDVTEEQGHRNGRHRHKKHGKGFRPQGKQGEQQGSDAQKPDAPKTDAPRPDGKQKNHHHGQKKHPRPDGEQKQNAPKDAAQKPQQPQKPDAQKQDGENKPHFKKNKKWRPHHHGHGGKGGPKDGSGTN